jgi:hypothetical protein
MKIAFYKGTRPFPASLFNYAVRWWTNGKYSHCELAFEYYKNAEEYVCMSSSFIDGGVRSKIMKLDPEKWDIIDLPSEKFSETKARQWFIDHLYQGYDVVNLLGFIWRRADGSKKKWTCSEACAAALELSEPWRFDPNSLFAYIKDRKDIL